MMHSMRFCVRNVKEKGEGAMRITRKMGGYIVEKSLNIVETSEKILLTSLVFCVGLVVLGVTTETSNFM